MAEKDSLAFTLSFSYANGETSGLNLTDNDALSDYATVTSTAGSQTNSDSIAITPRIRYGFGDDTNVSLQASFVALQTRLQNGNEISSTSSARFSSAQLGISHRFIEQGDTPSLIGSISTSLVENNSSGDDAYAKSWSLGLSSYRVFDPIVITGSMGYQLLLERDINQAQIDPGDVFFLNGGVSFVPNPNSSLSAGFTWSIRDKDKIDGVKQGIVRTSTSFNLGMGYEWSRETNVFVGVGMLVSGGDGASIAVSVTHDFDD